MNRTLHYLAFSFISMVSYGQEMFNAFHTKDLIKLEYEVYPSLNNIQLERKEIAIDFTSLLEKPIIGFGLDYTNHSVKFEDYKMYNNFSSIEELHRLQIYAYYKKTLYLNWDLSIVIAPFLSSTFTEKMSSDDFVFSYSTSFIKSWDKDGLKSCLQLGIGYGTLFGAPGFYPLLSYSNDLSKKIKYQIGIPITGIYYKVNDQSTIDIKAQPESIYANNASNFALEDNELLYKSKLEFSALKISLGYKFHFDRKWTSYFNIGYLTDSELTLTKNDHKIYDFDSNESLSLNVGISFNINKK